MNVLLFDIKRFALYDGKGIRTTLFFMGCPLTCRWCQNPEGQTDTVALYYNPDKCINCGYCIDACPIGKILPNIRQRFLPVPCKENCTACLSVCPSGAIKKVGESYSLDSLMKIIILDNDFYKISNGGVTCSGGEPLIHISFIEQLAKKLKSENIDLSVETCGSVPWENFERIIPLVSHFFYDIKIINNKLHREFTGIDNSLILDNFNKLLDRTKNITVRIPLIPLHTDTDENIIDIIHFLKKSKLIEKGISIELLPYNTLAETKYNKEGINIPTIPKYSINVKKEQTYSFLQGRKQMFIKNGFSNIRILSYE